jgi:hypothetical protein
VDAKQRTLIAEHAVQVFNRYQMSGHVDDGITTNWAIQAGSSTVKFQDRSSIERDVEAAVRRVWSLATRSKATDRAAESARPPADGPPRPLRFTKKKLFDKYAQRNEYRLRISVRGSEAIGESVVTLNDRGEFRWSAVADSTFRLEAGTSSRTLNEVDGGEILDLTAAAIEIFGFAKPREVPQDDAAAPAAAKRTRAQLFIESGFGDEDYMVEVTETDLDNNPPFQAAVRKLIDAAKKHRERQFPNE